MMSSPRLDMVIASRVFEEVTTEFGLTLSIAWASLKTDDVTPLELDGGSVDVVKEFGHW